MAICWLVFDSVAMNSGHPVPLSMIVRASNCSTLVVPGWLIGVNCTVQGPIMSTWTSSQGKGWYRATWVAVFCHIFLWQLSVILYCWHMAHVFTYVAIAWSIAGQYSFSWTQLRKFRVPLRNRAQNELRKNSRAGVVAGRPATEMLAPAHLSSLPPPLSYD
jgi:hypothetical protein